jgi:hypothetical protein
MLYAIARELDAALQAKNVPVRVFFGPERDSVGTRERIVIDYRGPASDIISPPRSLHNNPRMSWVRLTGATLRIYAQSALTGPLWHDHAERAEKILDHVLAELEVITKTRKTMIAFGAGGFIPDEDAPTEIPSGAIYELTFTVDRGVFRTNWEGEAAATVKIGPPPDVPIVSTTKVSDEPPPAGTPPADAETAC